MQISKIICIFAASNKKTFIMGSAFGQNVGVKKGQTKDTSNVVFQFKRLTSTEREQYRVGSYGYIM